MKGRRFYSYLILTLAAPLFCTAQGLKFAGLECPIDKRTSLDVFSSGSPAFTDHFSISFEFEMFPASEIGYIFRMKGAEDDKVYNLFYDGKGENHLFRLNEEGRYSLIKAEIPRDRMPDRWTEMDVYLDLKRDSLYLTIAGERFAAPCCLPDRYTPTINFGKSDHLIDVPSFAMRNLRVESRSRKYYFPLNERYGNTASDSDYRMRGTVTNPEWLINDSYQWTQVASMSLDTVATAVYGCNDRRFYYFTKDTVYTYDPVKETVSVRRFPSPCPVTMKLGMSLTDVGGGDKIYVYEPYAGHEVTNPVSVASLDPETLEWSVLSTDRIDMQVHHHAPFKTGIEGMPFAFFGGFGNQRYNGSFYGFDINGGRWVDITGNVEEEPVICPRYFTSAGRDEATGDIYIFGGMGNESGEQVVGRRYLYDLYRVNLEKREAEKLWEIKWDGVNMVPVRNMVVTDPGHFLVLCYPESVSNSKIQLYRFSVEDGTFQALATEIPIRSDRISTNANLYFDSQLEKLFAVVQEYDDHDVKSTLKIYSLAYPPLTEAELVSYSGINSGGGISLLLVFALMGVAVVILAGVAIVYARRKDAGAEDVQMPEDEQPEEEEEPKRSQEWLSLSSRANSVFLFGDMFVRDRDGEIISSVFTTRQKQIFCLALQYGEEGISSKRLSNLLWPEATEEQAKNLRGSTISKFRKTLRRLDGVEFVYKDGRFMIVTGPDFYCDYLRCREIMASGEPDYTELVTIVSGGRFLSFIEEPIFDDFKKKVEEDLIPFLTLEMNRRFNLMDYEGAVQIADAIFNVDSLNEHALILCVKAFRELREIAEAAARYSAFAGEYKRVYDVPYPKNFNEI